MTTKKINQLLFAIPAVLLGMFVSNASGQNLVNFDFSGTIDAAAGIPEDVGFLPTPDALSDLVGEDFSVDISFADDLTDIIPGGGTIFPDRAIFQPIDVTGTFGVNNFSGQGQLTLRDGERGFDEFRVSIPFGDVLLDDPTGAFADFNETSFDLVLTDSTSTAFDGTALITEPLDLDDFDLSLAGLRFNNGLGTNGGTLVVDLDSAGGSLTIPQQQALVTAFLGAGVAVPEPSGALPLAFAVFGYALRRKKRA